MSTFSAYNPRTGQAGTAIFEDSSVRHVEAVVAAAESAFRSLTRSESAGMAAILRAIADELNAQGGRLIEAADRETGLGGPRLMSELDRTTAQFRFFADECDEGSFVEAVIDHARVDLSPPRPDLRRMLLPLGPVAVFGASNFPFAFSVPGGDTASALAARCPVVVKAHPSHPETSELCAGAILRALQRTGAPEGTFAIVHGRSKRVGEMLVVSQGIRAVGFTGSVAGGRALFDLASRRPVPIAVYAEMGSINPFFVTERALDARMEAIAQGFVSSMTQGAGQFCTKPGLAVISAAAPGRRWTELITSKLTALEPGHLLRAEIRDALADQVQRALRVPGVRLLASSGLADRSGFTYPATLLGVDARTFLASRELVDEHFGPVGFVVTCEVAEQMLEIARGFTGSLTATIHAEPSEAEAIRPLAEELREKVGRLIWNEYPTGVAVSHAMMHGGPYPSSTNLLHTSVGSAAIKRWLRHVAFQAYPETLLPRALRDANPLGILRRVDGEWSRRPSVLAAPRQASAG